MGEQRSDFGLYRGTAGLGRPRIGGSRADPPNCAQLKPTLTEAGIDKHLANRVPQHVAIPVDKFEHLVRRGAFRAIAGFFGWDPTNSSRSAGDSDPEPWPYIALEIDCAPPI